jgi:hypothetical protein
MKKLIQHTSFFIIAFVSTIFAAFAQGNFEGKIVFTISYTDLPAEMKNFESMLPKDMTIMLKGNKSRVEQSQMMGKNVIVTDMDQKNGFVEMDMGGQKLRMNISTKEFEAEENILKNVEYLDETKTIAGYPSKKAIVKDDSGAVMMTLFYTEKIKNQAQKEFAGLKGFPLEYSMSQNNINMVIAASEISEEKVADAVFVKSDGYQDITQDDLQKMMGGGQ